MKTEICLVLTTCPDRDVAERLSAMLVEQRLAACVSIGSPVTSSFPWEGRIDTEQEIPLTIKTTQHRVEALEGALVDAHPYEVPELLVVPVTGGLEAYTNWIKDWTG